MASKAKVRWWAARDKGSDRVELWRGVVPPDRAWGQFVVAECRGAAGLLDSFSTWTWKQLSGTPVRSGQCIEIDPPKFVRKRGKR